jgi:hypothetical protein
MPPGVAVSAKTGKASICMAMPATMKRRIERFLGEYDRWIDVLASIFTEHRDML